jgi:mannitol-1-phosphate 5-dehydrogenase
MTLTESRYQIEKDKILIFGAGKIGRSFIGQLFGTAGYNVVFADIDKATVDLLNYRGCYKVILKGEADKEIVVNNVKAISASDETAVAEAVSTCAIISVSVGKNAIEKVIPLIARGLILRRNRFPEEPVDIIIAENMISGREFVRNKLSENMPEDYPIDELVGLVETSIGKMVPIMTQSELTKDPLMVYAEPYNTLILDRKGFKTPIPEIRGLAPKENIKAWVDRKAFIHNLGHATAAYYGYFVHPESEYIYEVLNDDRVLEFTRSVMLESADILLIAYPDDFDPSSLAEHIDDLLSRFGNRALRDTLYRVGHDLARKLSYDDRFMGAVHLAKKYHKPYRKIIDALSYGFIFKAKDDEGNFFARDLKLMDSLSLNFETTLINDLGFNPSTENTIISELKKKYEYLYALTSKSQ